MKLHCFIVVATVAYYILAAGSLHFLNRELDPIIWPMSAYVNGPYGFVMTTTFFALAIALATLVHALLSAPYQRRVSSYIASTLFVIAVVGCTLAGIFPMDEQFPPKSLSGRLHGIGGMLAFPTMAVAPLFVTCGPLRHSTSRKRLFFVSLFAVLSFACMPAMIAAIELGQTTPSMRIAGLMQRLFFAFLFVWMILSVVLLGTQPVQAWGAQDYNEA